MFCLARTCPVSLARSGGTSSKRHFGFFSSIFGRELRRDGNSIPQSWRVEKVSEEVTTTVFFDIAVDGKSIGQVTMGLFGGAVPKTAENFRSLCVGDKRLSFKGSPFHRIIPGFMCQGGDFTKFDGTGGESIYGGKFADESFAFKHTTEGLLSMANSGPNTNLSQFFITTGPTEWLDNKHVVFGRVLAGMDVVRKMEAFGSKPSGQTSAKVTIADCGEVSASQKDSEAAGETPKTSGMPASGPTSETVGTPAPGCSGTVYTILKEGAGASVVKGSRVAVHATGVVQETGKKFWSTKDPGQETFCYTAGVGEVIKGWDQGLLGMKTGEERQVIIPGAEGYGSKGFPAWGIPANATLEFTLEVLTIDESRTW